MRLDFCGGANRGAEDTASSHRSFDTCAPCCDGKGVRWARCGCGGAGQPWYIFVRI